MLSAKLEAILFASGEPLYINDIKKILQIRDIEPVILELESKLRDRGITLLKLDKKLQLCAKPEYADVVRLALEERKEHKLSKSALEVLVVTAYYQPITKAKIGKIRGVDSVNTVKGLCTKGFLETCGRLDVIGKPRLYRTTDKFLRVFGIEKLAELPDISEFATRQTEIAGDVC